MCYIGFHFHIVNTIKAESVMYTEIYNFIYFPFPKKRKRLDQVDTAIYVFYIEQMCRAEREATGR